jgi:hypothetical protein
MIKEIDMTTIWTRSGDESILLQVDLYWTLTDKFGLVKFNQNQGLISACNLDGSELSAEQEANFNAYITGFCTAWRLKN